MANDPRAEFRDLHKSGLFIMPKPWDVGSARLLAALGFLHWLRPARATPRPWVDATSRSAATSC